MAYDVSDLVPAEKAPTYYGLELFEHYDKNGYLMVATSDMSSVRLEPGDFIVKRLWSTAVVPYIFKQAEA